MDFVLIVIVCWGILENKEGTQFCVLVSEEQKQEKKIDGDISSVGCWLPENTTKKFIDQAKPRLLLIVIKEIITLTEC